jgi:hypothetical protein
MLTPYQIKSVAEEEHGQFLRRASVLTLLTEVGGLNLYFVAVGGIAVAIMGLMLFKRNA